MTDELDNEIYEIVDNLHEYCPDCEHPVCVNGKIRAKQAIQALIAKECNKAKLQLLRDIKSSEGFGKMPIGMRDLLSTFSQSINAELQEKNK
jgi:hypothetical protein